VGIFNAGLCWNPDVIPGAQPSQNTERFVVVTANGQFNFYTIQSNIVSKVQVRRFFSSQLTST
jgi:hypothetical protein